MQKVLDKTKVKKLSNMLSVTGDENRLKILCFLFQNKKYCVGDIAEGVGLSIANTSHHLQTLAKTGLVDQQREGKNICYQISDHAFIKDLKKVICNFEIL